MESYLEQLIWSQDEPIRRLGVHPPVFRVQAGRGQRRKGHPGGRGSGRAVLRATRATWITCACYRRYWRPLPGPARTAAPTGRGPWPGASGARTCARRPWPTIVDRAARASRASIFWGGATVFWEAQKSLVLGPGLRSDMAMAEPDPARQCPHGLRHAAARLPGAPIPFPWSAHCRDLLEAAADKSMPGADVLTRMIHAEFRMRSARAAAHARWTRSPCPTSLEARVPYLDHELRGACPWTSPWP